MADPITIDGIRFRAINKWKNDGYKQHLTFTSTTPDGVTKTLCAYKSQSEVGTWRLFVMLKPGGPYYKGAPYSIPELGGTIIFGLDYVQQSFIHYDLQKYFNQVLDMLPEITGRYDISVELEKYTPERGTVDDDILIQSVKDEIDRPSRMEKIEPFISYFNSPDNRCGLSAYTRDKNLLEFSNVLERTFPAIGEPELVYKNYRFVDKDTTSFTLPTGRVRRFVNNILLDADIYKVKMGEVDGKNIILYFMIYKLNTSVDTLNNSSKEAIEPLNREYKTIPVFLTTSDEITPFGLYSKYILAGDYICKLLEYTQQCRANNIRCTKTYSFIGDIYNEVYPLTTPAIQALISDKRGSEGVDVDASALADAP